MRSVLPSCYSFFNILVLTKQFWSMKTLFVNNFRHFNNVFIELNNLNFFVGENSTGKTSIIKLMGVLSSPGFWNYQIFDKEFFNLGSFTDLVSMDSELPFFEVGLLYNNNGDCAIKFRFIEQNNQPKVKEIFFANNEINCQISLEGHDIKYKGNFENIFLEKESSIHSVFEKWINNNGLAEIELLRFSDIDYIGIRSIFYQIQQILNNKFKKEIKSFYTPKIENNLAWIAPIRAEPLRTYDNYTSTFSSDGSHVPYVLKKLLKVSSDFQRILQRFGKDSDLFQDIKIKNLAPDLEINRTNEDMYTEYNNATNIPFEVDVIINDKHINLINVGYGVPQILPVLVEILGRPTPTWFTIQQPETHLHPKAQAAFGDFVYKAVSLDNHNFIIETHSDYLIDRYRLRMKRANKEKEKVSESKILFFSKDENGNKVSSIQLNKDGSLPDNLPSDYRDFFLKEKLNIISI